MWGINLSCRDDNPYNAFLNPCPKCDDITCYAMMTKINTNMHLK